MQTAIYGDQALPPSQQHAEIPRFDWGELDEAGEVYHHGDETDYAADEEAAAGMGNGFNLDSPAS